MFNVSVLFSEPKIPQLEASLYKNVSVSSTFQCSSASRKFLNSQRREVLRHALKVSVLFSEPKIPQFNVEELALGLANVFQCSSASRKFLNRSSAVRIERSAIVSVLFSEPKIPQWNDYVHN